MSDTVEEVHLIKVESRANSNKFYRLILGADGKVTKQWGRVGAKGQASVETGGQANFDRTLHQKLSRGYTRVDVLATGTVAAGANTNLKAAARQLIDSDDPTLTDLIDRLVATNKHDLLEASGGLITVDTSGQVTTPLGIISTASIADARRLLDQMSVLPAGRALGALTDEYLRLVPQKVSVSLGAGWADTWLHQVTTTEKQYDLLDALSASVAHADDVRRKAVAAADASSADTIPTDLFRYRVKLLSPGDDGHDMVVARYQETTQGVHAHARGVRVKNVFELTDVRRADEVQATADRIRNVRRLWHGTGAANVLSIMRSGLFVPARRGTGIHIAGRMFGDGIYLSRSASKSLGYAKGVWGGGKQASTFMFLTETAMGSEYRPNGPSYDAAIPKRARTERNQFGNPYDSINVFAGKAGVRNPESIVWDPDQVRLRYLVEFED